jgi:type I restriction enzyme R subunit
MNEAKTRPTTSKAHDHFNDPEWDGEPIAPEPREESNRPRLPIPQRPIDEFELEPPRKRIQVKLADGKARAIQHMM